MFVLVVAKEPVAGRVKTRLCPPCTAESAAAIAEAALADTFDNVMACGADEVVVALDGRPGAWLPAGVRVVPQVDGPFDRRLTAAWAATTGPGVQIGMDTPQVRPEDLDDAMARLERDDVDAVLGRAIDGGWWAIGLPEADDRVFSGVPMSSPTTGERQRARLDDLGYRVDELALLHDVDHYEEALAVARLVPGSRFARAVHAVREETSA